MLSFARKVRPAAPGESLAQRRAFSLIEVVVVLAILLTILALVLPSLSFSNATAGDLSAQGNIGSVLTAEVNAFSQSGAFLDTTSPSDQALTQQLPQLSLVSGATASTSPSQVSLQVATSGQSVGLAALGGNGTCWLEQRNFQATGTTPTTVYAARQSGGTTACDGSAALALTPSTTAGTSWTHPLLAP